MAIKKPPMEMSQTFLDLGYFNSPVEPAHAPAIFVDEKCLLRLPENRVLRTISDRLSVSKRAFTDDERPLVR